MNLSFFIFICLAVLTGLFFFHRHEKKYLQKRTRDILSPDVQKSIERERQNFLEKKIKFEKTLLKKTQKKQISV